jgi:hypothetical protein
MPLHGRATSRMQYQTRHDELLDSDGYFYAGSDVTAWSAKCIRALTKMALIRRGFDRAATTHRAMTPRGRTNPYGAPMFIDQFSLKARPNIGASIDSAHELAASIRA